MTGRAEFSLRAALVAVITACAPPERENAGWLSTGIAPANADDDDGADPAEASTSEEPPGSSGGADDEDDGDPTGVGMGTSSGGVGSSSGGGDTQSPYAGGWDIGNCQESIPLDGSTSYDWIGFDQFGDEVRLYDFCHKAVLVHAATFT